MNPILPALSAFVALVPPDAGDARPVAEAYLDAYQSQDFEALAALYAADASFIDPTSFDVGDITPPISWRGKAQILDGLASWGVVRLDYAIDRSFAASGRVVFDGAVTAVYATQSGQRAFVFPIVTIVTVDAGEVIEHRDYTDYAGMHEQPASTGN